MKKLSCCAMAAFCLLGVILGHAAGQDVQDQHPEGVAWAWFAVGPDEQLRVLTVDVWGTGMRIVPPAQSEAVIELVEAPFGSPEFARRMLLQRAASEAWVQEESGQYASRLRFWGVNEMKLNSLTGDLIWAPTLHPALNAPRAAIGYVAPGQPTPDEFLPIWTNWRNSDCSILMNGNLLVIGGDTQAYLISAPPADVLARWRAATEYLPGYPLIDMQQPPGAEYSPEELQAFAAAERLKLPRRVGGNPFVVQEEGRYPARTVSVAAFGETIYVSSDKGQIAAFDLTKRKWNGLIAAPELAGPATILAAPDALWLFSRPNPESEWRIQRSVNGADWEAATLPMIESAILPRFMGARFFCGVSIAETPEQERILIWRRSAEGEWKQLPPAVLSQGQTLLDIAEVDEHVLALVGSASTTTPGLDISIVALTPGNLGSMPSHGSPAGALE